MNDGFHKECPDCGCRDIWDADCEECNGSQQNDDGSDCPECEGSGYNEGISECADCGMQDAAHTFDAPDTPKEKTP